MTKHTLSVIIPCFNEEKTLQECVLRVLGIQSDALELEIIVVDDGSSDNSVKIANELAAQYSQIRVLVHQINQGKGAALATGFRSAGGGLCCHSGCGSGI
jgi:glycosyltransferase involved in cell wall biosynthesis